MSKPTIIREFFLATFMLPDAHDPGWPFSTQHNGYGKIRFDGRVIVVSKLACMLAHGPMPAPGMHAAHSCPQNHKCFWAEHLSWKTPPENEADKVRDGTAAITIPAEMIAEIRVRYAVGDISQHALGRELGINQSYISKIIRNRARNHLPGPDQPQSPPR